MSKRIDSQIVSVIVAGNFSCQSECAENRKKIKVAITIVMSLPELLKGTYFSNSFDENFMNLVSLCMCILFSMCVIV